MYTLTGPSIKAIVSHIVFIGQPQYMVKLAGYDASGIM